jgi:hypothetical protein
LFSFKELPFDEEEKASAETVFAISNEEEIYMISITALNPLDILATRPNFFEKNPHSDREICKTYQGYCIV